MVAKILTAWFISVAAVAGLFYVGWVTMGVAYDDFESYTNGQILATTTSNVVAGSQWGRFGAATASNPIAETNAGTSGSVAVDYPLNWSSGNNGNLEFWFSDTLVLTSAPGVSVNLRIDTPALSNTTVEAAFEQTDGTVWQTTVGQVLTNTSYQSFVFTFTSNTMSQASGSGAFNLKIVKDLRLRFLNNGGSGSQHVYVDDFGAVTWTNQTLLTSRGLFTQNAMWLSGAYTYQSSYVSLVPSLAQNMQYLDKVEYWFVNSTTVGTNGVLNDPGFQFSQVTNFLDAVNLWETQHGHRFVLVAWLNATITNAVGPDMTNPTTRSNLVVECEKLVSTNVPGSYVAKAKRTFDGVHFDFEPSGGNSNVFNGLLLLMDQVRAGFTSVGLTNGGYISFAAERYQTNTTSTARWTPDNYYDMGQEVDSLGVMLYDTTITSISQFQNLVCDQTSNIVRAVSGEYWNDLEHPAPTNHPLVYMGFAAYATDSDHDGSVENITNAAIGADCGVIGMINHGDPAVNYFGGSIIFKQTDGTGSDGAASYTNDWERFQEYWLWGCLDCSLSADPIPLASVLQVQSIALTNGDVQLTWSTLGGSTNFVQATSGDGSGNYSTNFANISPAVLVQGGAPPMVFPGAAEVSTSYVDVGAASSHSVRYYRISGGP